MISCIKIGDIIEICVKDDGSGIKEEIMPYIFDRFYKGDDGNFGIGLSILKSITEQHKGTVKAVNAENGGAVFTLVFSSTSQFCKPCP